MAKSLQVQDLPRVNEIAGVLATNGFGQMLHAIGLANRANTPADDAKPWARRIRQVLVELGPAYVKLGQVLSVRPDIVPEDLLNELQTLQDRVPPMSMEDVKEVVEKELRAPLEEVFQQFDPEPLGSASIAQVHRAVLKDGQVVAVKLQRKGIEAIIDSDLHILYTLSQIVERNVRLPGMYTPTAIVREFDKAIHEELDFLHEMKSCQRMGRHAAGSDIKIPQVHEAFSTRRLLVLELIEGRSLRQVMASAEGANVNRLAHQIMEATYRQVFEWGFFHGDPHPGNLVVTPDGKLAFLDFGVCGLLTGQMQDVIVNAFTSMVFRDAETLALTVYRAGATQGGRVDLKAFIEENERLMVKYHGASLQDIANPATFVEVVQLCARFHINLPPEFAVLARAMALIEGEIRTLLPGVDIVEETKPYAKRLVTQRFAPERMAQDMARLAVLAQGHMRDVPTQLNQVMMDLQGGSITIITKDPDAVKLREEIRAAVLRLSLAALGSTVTMGSLLFLAVWSPAPFGIPVFGLFSMFGLGAGMAIFGALGVHVLFASLFDLRAWKDRILGVLRFFSWRRRS